MVSGASIWVVPRSKRDDVSGDRQETGVLTLKVSWSEHPHQGRQTERRDNRS